VTRARSRTKLALGLAEHASGAVERQAVTVVLYVRGLALAGHVLNRLESRDLHEPKYLCAWSHRVAVGRRRSYAA
jgi:hypothetical protein